MVHSTQNGVVCAPADSEAQATPEPTGDDFKRAVSVLLPYLLSHRTRLASLEDGSDAAEQNAAAPHAGSYQTPEKDLLET